MLFNKWGFSDATLCAAVAHHIVLDAVENTLSTGCFPMIRAQRTNEQICIEISTELKVISFFVAEEESTKMVENLMKLEQRDMVLMDCIQEAVAQLEGA